MRAEGYAVESILRVLRRQGLSIAARTYRSLKHHPARVADRTVTDALVEDKIRDGCDSLVWPRCDGLIWPRVRLAGVLTV